MQPKEPRGSFGRTGRIYLSIICARNDLLYSPFRVIYTLPQGENTNGGTRP
nr:MAG TPA: hypothetical protein [Caudoviricetes sp.]